MNKQELKDKIARVERQCSDVWNEKNVWLNRQRLLKIVSDTSFAKNKALSKLENEETQEAFEAFKHASSRHDSANEEYNEFFALMKERSDTIKKNNAYSDLIKQLDEIIREEAMMDQYHRFVREW